MNEENTLENLEEYFRKVNCFGSDNCCFSGSTIQNNMFGLVGALFSIKKNKNVMGYLLNKNENGICLIPIVVDTFTKNKIDIDNYVFLKNDDIEKVTVKNEDIGFKRITILLKDKTKYVLKVPKKIRNVDYHENNLNRFIEMYN